MDPTGRRTDDRLKSSVMTRVPPKDGLKRKKAACGDAGSVLARLAFSAPGSTWPQGGSDFFNCIVMSDVSAETSGAILQAAIAINISMMARVSALTLAAR